MKHKLFVCPVTRKPLIELEDGSLKAANMIYRKENNIFLLNPETSDEELNDYYEFVNSAKITTSGNDFFEGDFDPIETYYRRSRKLCLVKFLPKYLGVAVDIGGGAGALFRSLVHSTASRFDKLILIDWTKGQMAPVAKKFKQDKRYVFAQADAMRLPIANDSVDFIFNSEMIEHLYPNQSENMLAEFYRILKPGGKVLITTPNGLDYRRLIQENILSVCLLMKGIWPKNLRERERLKSRIYRRYLSVTGHTFVNVDEVERTGQIGHFNILSPRALMRQIKRQRLVVRRTEFCIFIPFIVPRFLSSRKLSSSMLDFLETAFKKIRLNWLFLSCQAHLLEKPH